MDTLNKLNEIFRSVLDDDAIEITPETSPDNCDEWDSLAQLQLITECEHIFGIKFTVNDIEKLKSVANFIESVERKTHD